MSVLVLLMAGLIDLLGPGTRPVSRNQVNERGDGSGNYVEFALSQARSGTGFTTVRTYTTKRDAGKLARLALSERDIQMPFEGVQVARLPYEFAVTSSTPSANRVAILAGAPEATVRALQPSTLAAGRPVSVPANARLIGLRPGTEEAWTAHSGSLNQMAIVDLVNERVLTSFQLRINPQAVPVGLAFSANGRTAWVVVRHAESLTERGTVLIVDCANRQIVNTVSLGTNVPSTAALSPDGTLLLIAGTSLNDLSAAENSVLGFDTGTNAFTVLTIGAANLSMNQPRAIFWHPDGTRAYSLQPQTGTLEVYEVAARRVTRRIVLPRESGLLDSMDVSQNGDFALVRDVAGANSYLIDLETGETLDAAAIPAGVGFLLPRF